MAYADELDAVIAAEQGLRRRIAERIALEQGASGEGPLSPQHLAAADAAIENWAEAGEEELDPQAFRPLTPLQDILAEHRAVCDRILDIRDRRLG